MLVQGFHNEQHQRRDTSSYDSQSSTQYAAIVWVIRVRVLSYSERCGSSDGTIRASSPSACIEARTPASRCSLSMGSSVLVLMLILLSLLLIYLAVSLAPACFA